jgi:hypothetical protein
MLCRTDILADEGGDFSTIAANRSRRISSILGSMLVNNAPDSRKITV